MSEIEEKVTCPLGSTCFEIKDNVPHRCAWHTQMKGVDASGEEHDKWSCAIAWMPVLQTETSATNRGQTAALESLRNETVVRQDIALNAIVKGGGDETKVIEAK